MASKKPDYTEQQIVQYLLSGGTVEELSKSSKVNTNQILSAIVNNPQVFTSLKTQAENTASGLDKFDPSLKYAAPDSYIPISNPVTEEYARLEPKARELAKTYHDELYSLGNNPAYKIALDQKYKAAAIAGGMNEHEANALVGMFSKNSDKWFTAEIDKQRKDKEIQFKAFETQRKTLDLKQGDNPLYAAMSKLTGGYGGLANVINPDVTWEQIAKSNAAKDLITTKGKAPKGGFTNVRQAEITLDTTKSSKDIVKQQQDYVQGYLNVVASKLPKGQTPYKTSVKKLLPYLQSNNPFGK